jgi:hypothetical protein
VQYQLIAVAAMIYVGVMLQRQNIYKLAANAADDDRAKLAQSWHPNSSQRLRRVIPPQFDL